MIYIIGGELPWEEGGSEGGERERGRETSEVGDLLNCSLCVCAHSLFFYLLRGRVSTGSSDDDDSSKLH